MALDFFSSFDFFDGIFGGGKEQGSGNLSPMIIPPPAVPNNTNNNVNVSNNFNQNITSATPQQFANDTNKQIISSINNARQQVGAL